MRLKRHCDIRDRIRVVIDALSGVTDARIAERMDHSTTWVKKWISRYKKFGFEGLADQERSGAPIKLNEDQIIELYLRILEGPREDEALCRYRISDIQKLVKDEWRVDYSLSGMHALMKHMKLSHVTPRPQHPKNDPVIMEKWKRKARRFVLEERSRRGKNLQLWFQDESRFGQKGIVTKLWTIQGERPQIIRQNGFKSAYFFGAVNPDNGDKSSLLFDGVDSRVMNIFLDNISQTVSPRVHILMFVDGAGWHSSDELEVPKNMALYHLPPYSPELNPIERLWDYLKENYLSGCVFANMDEIFDYGVRAWNTLEPETIKTVCRAPWFQ
jgi:transposase